MVVFRRAASLFSVATQLIHIVGANHLKEPRRDGTCCDGVADCGGVSAENVGGWGHVGRDLRFREPNASNATEMNASTVKITPRPYYEDLKAGYTYGMYYVEGLYVHAAIGATGQGLDPILRTCGTCSPYWQTVGLWKGRRSMGPPMSPSLMLPDGRWRRDAYHYLAHRYNLYSHSGARRSTNSSNSTTPTAPVPTPAPTYAPPRVTTSIALGGIYLSQFDATEQNFFRSKVALVSPDSCGAVGTSPRACVQNDVVISSTARRQLAITFYLETANTLEAFRLRNSLGSQLTGTNFTNALKSSPGALSQLTNITITQMPTASHPPLPTPAPTPVAPLGPAPPVPLTAWNEHANATYFPVANYRVMPRNGNVIRKHSGIHIPICQQKLVIKPTRLEPVPAPPPPIGPAPPVTPTMVCWDGTVCPGRKIEEGIQCCSAPVMAGDTCAQIFICDQKRTCTGPRACYQQFDSLWDINNNGWQLAGIVSFIFIMILFLCIFLLYCCCDRCIINRRKYAAQRERKKYLQALPQMSALEVAS